MTVGGEQSVDEQVETLERALWLLVAKYLNDIPVTSISECDRAFLSTPLTTPHGLSWCQGENLFGDTYTLRALVERRQYTFLVQGNEVFAEVYEHLQKEEYTYDLEPHQLAQLTLNEADLNFLEFYMDRHDEPFDLEVLFKEAGEEPEDH